MEENTTSKRKVGFLLDPEKSSVWSSHHCLVISIYWVTAGIVHSDI